MRWLLDGGPSGFQSTLPVWGATWQTASVNSYLTISIHAPRVGSDTRVEKHRLTNVLFQSTLPVWGAT